ncbi:MAG: tRNA pseudouridine(55) synthase TruB [Magnetococcales bacterium]|nr:tRNA pseudouridine(55) synthase TruB [Magnetococcales bacterium]
MSSAQGSDAVRRIFNAAKAGHGGTLDPFSEGLLPVAMGEATKALGLVLEGDKHYRCHLRFGVETDTGDPTGKSVGESSLIPDQVALEALLPEFLGEQDQIPPIYSAIHVGGERAYKLAREGVALDLPPRRVVIREMTLESFNGTDAVIAVWCGKGTYMRALARDIGRRLGGFAHLTRLIRTATLGFSSQEALTLEQLRTLAQAGSLQEAIHPLDRVLDDIPALRLGVEAWRQVRHGQAVWLQTEGTESRGDMARLLTPEGRCGAVGTFKGPADEAGRRCCHPHRLFLSA